MTNGGIIGLIVAAIVCLAAFVFWFVLYYNTSPYDNKANTRFALSWGFLALAIIAIIFSFFFTRDNGKKELYLSQEKVYNSFVESGKADMQNCIIVADVGDTLNFFGKTEYCYLYVVKDGVVQSDYKTWKESLRKGIPSISELRNLFGYNSTQYDVISSEDFPEIPIGTYIYVINERKS